MAGSLRDGPLEPGESEHDASNANVSAPVPASVPILILMRALATLRIGLPARATSRLPPPASRAYRRAKTLVRTSFTGRLLVVDDLRSDRIERCA